LENIIVLLIFVFFLFNQILRLKEEKNKRSSAACIFNIDGISLSRLFAAIGIHVPTNYYKISSSSSKWRCSNSFTNWSSRLGFVGDRDL
jgi:hypothetical protein